MSRFSTFLSRILSLATRSQFLLTSCVLCLALTYLWLLQSNSVAAAQKQVPSLDGIWQPVALKQLASKPAPDIPSQAQTLRLDAAALRRTLSTATRETGNSLANSRTILPLPLPNGDYAAFRIEESPVLDDALAARFPEIKSFRGVAVDDARITMRADWTPQGLHVLILSPQRTYSIHPVSQNTASEYVSYDAGAAQAATQKDFQCLINDQRVVNQDNNKITAPLLAVGSSRANYRLALAATWEYCNYYGNGTIAGTVASLNTWLNSINAIYERELNIHLTMVNDTDALYCAERGFSDATDPFTNGDTITMLGQVRPVLRDQVGAGNYDIGHVMGTGGGGVAWLGVVCNDANINGDNLGPGKGGGVSCISGSLGSASALNVIVHEMGHQFGAAHSFNGTNSNCAGGNRSSGSAVEPGSGTTIMSYAGLCSTDNVTGGSDLRFHAWSFAQITNFVNSKTCQTTINTGNTAPTVNGGSDYTIPQQTPFELTATGNDADAADVPNLTYTWEQVDPGGSSYGNPPYTDAADPANSTRPLFRSYGPVSSPARTFPALNYILNFANTAPALSGGYQSADFLSSINRTLRFRAVVRDQRGGVTDDEVLLTVNASAGPFLVTAPNTAVSWTGGSQQTVTWSVNNTNAAPISCANVRILLSTDGGQSFPYTLASNTPNDGSETITVPANLISSTARIRVQAVGNIFFDISDANFTLTPGGSCPAVSGLSPSLGSAGTSVVITGINFTGVSAVRFGSASAVFTVTSATTISATVPAGATGGPVTIVKPGCNDTQTPAFSLCSTAASNLQIDDGSLEQSIGYSSGTSYFVNRLTPGGYPATVSTVTVAVNRPAGTAFEVLVGTNTDGNTSVDGTTFQAVSATSTGANQFITVAVPATTISTGDFVVGYRITALSGTYPGSMDNSTGSQQRSFASTSGTSFQLVDSLNFPGNLGVRAAIYLGACNSTSGPACPTVSNLTPANGNVGTTVVISGTQLTGVSAVKFSNNVTASFTVNSDSQITATVPGGAVSGPITISKAGCGDVQTSAYTVTPCTYTVTPSRANFAATGGSGSLTLTTSSNQCSWTSSNPATGWITNLTPASGNDTRTITFNVAANTGSARMATLTIAGQAVTITQLSTNPTADVDADAIPDSVEIAEATNLVVKDNNIYADTTTSRRLFVMQQYRDFLGREGDAGGITNWTNALSGGTLTRAQVVESFFDSAEFQGIGAPMVRLYFAYFQRIPDYVGLQNWINAYRAGTPLANISNSFASSAEFVQTYGSLNNTQFVTLVYNNVLGRAPDPSGLTAWVNALNGGMSRGEVMLGFSESAEYKLRSANWTYVTMMYVGMLRRAPEQAGFDGWVDYLNRGNSGLALIQGFIDALEYHNRFLP